MTRAHLVTGGFPRGANAGHDMDYARLQLLQILSEYPDVVATTANDYSDIASWLDGTSLLITYVAGPYPSDVENEAIRSWLEKGGRWFGLHGTSGGKAARIEGQQQRAMVKGSYHATLGGFFLNHPPLRKFTVRVQSAHPLATNLPPAFEVADELYLVEMQGEHDVWLTTEIAADPSPPGFGFVYEEDTSVQGDGRTRVLGYTKEVGAGAVAYVSLGHCHSKSSNVQPFVDASVSTEGETPPEFHGSWEIDAFRQIVRNAVTWGIETQVEHSSG